jgi:DNA-binding transcriptional regulator YdaS (Cro superfamily)
LVFGCTITFVIANLDRAADLVGGASILAKKIDVSQSATSMWRARGSVPPDRCPAIERATDGRVTCEELRPDVRWQRVPDAAWPHALGRPCIDVAAPEREAKVA